MRLYDELLARGFTASASESMYNTQAIIAASLSGAEVVVADNVTDYWWQQAITEWRPGSQLWEYCPNVAPPFRRFFIETRTAASQRGVWRIRANGRDVPIRRWGLLVAAFEWTGQDWDRELRPVWSDTKGWVEDVPSRSSLISTAAAACAGRCRWLLISYLVIAGKEMRFPVCVSVIPVGERGAVDRELLLSHCGLRALIPGYARMNATAQEELTMTWQIMHAPLLLAVSFMHCKNVALERVEPPAKLDRLHRKYCGRPLVRYHTITIDPMRHVLRRDGGSDTVGLKRALHICRGHFATYDERPLFGRVTGTFWREAHVRGSAASGVVRKDYRVKGQR
jgi:hypothetical protein